MSVCVCVSVSLSVHSILAFHTIMRQTRNTTDCRVTWAAKIIKKEFCLKMQVRKLLLTKRRLGKCMIVCN